MGRKRTLKIIETEADDDTNNLPKRRTNCRPTATELKNMWNFMKITKHLGTRQQCIEFAEDNNLILRSKMCNVHRKPMSFIESSSNLGTFVCRKGTCRSKSGVSRAKGTWFEQAKVSLPSIFYLMYAYARHWPQSMVQLENCIDDTTPSTRTITDWYNYCREAVVRYYIEKQEAVEKIGGPGKRVQIDEVKFGKSDENKAKSMEGKWVLGMIEDNSDDLRLEIVCVSSSDTLIPLIKKHVCEGTIIRTEFHQLCESLTENGYECQANTKLINVNDPQSKKGKIDANWWISKRFHYRDNYKNPENYAEVIIEFAWRKSVARKHTDPYVELIEAIKYSYGV